MGFSMIFLGFILCSNLHAGVYALAVCRSPFERYGNRCYKVIDTPAIWQDAKDFCAVIGGDLARIDRASIQDVITEIIEKQPMEAGFPKRYWLDGTDLLKPNDWRWMRKEGASIPFTYTNWNGAEPNNIGTERCVEIIYSAGWNYKWNNYPCNATDEFICEATTTNQRREIRKL